MLATLRKALKSWVATLLILLLIASFAVWGIGDVFTGRGGTSVAVIGETELSAQEFARAIERQRGAIMQRTEQVISYDELRARRIDAQVLAQLVRQKTLDEEVRRLGISVPDAAVSSDVKRMFAADGAAFSMADYQEQLRRQGFSVAEFEALTRSRVAAGIVISAVAEAPPGVEGAAAAIAARQGEERAVRLMRIGPDAVETPEAPDEAALAAWWEARQAAYREPERRNGQFVLVDASAMIPDFMPDDATVEAEYETMSARLTEPATRDIDQVVFTDIGTASSGALRVAAGEITFEELAAEAGLTPAQAAIGQVTASDLPAPVAEQVFATSEPGVIGPVPTGVGFAVIRINAATDAFTIPLDMIRDQLALQIAQNAAREAARDKAVEVGDFRAASLPFEEIAEKAGATFGSFAGIDPQGDLADGAKADGLPADPAFFAEVFAAESGADRDLVELSDGSYVLVMVEDVVPARPLTLDEAREQLTADWRAEQTLVLLDELGARLAGFASGPSGDLRAVAAGRRGARVEEVGPFDRYGAPESIGNALWGEVFKLADGDAVSGRAPDGSGVIVAELAEIVPLDAERLADGEAQIADLLADSLGGDLLEYYGRALEARFEAGVDPAAIDAVFNELSSR